MSKLSTTASRLAPLRRFVREMTQLVASTRHEESQLLAEGGQLLKALIADDNWLPERFAFPSLERYQQYLLHCDPLERFSVVSFVWGPGQSTPVHDHTTWGLVGMLRGAERTTNYAMTADGRLTATGVDVLQPGDVAAVSPHIGDVHAVSNAHSDRPSISIHVYGANIGAVHRHVYDPEKGSCKSFVSGYACEVMPNIWNSGTAV
ncbi:cysteine dioxygenase [Halomonas kalidii]|uniref:Cysteine dioxygenase n=1 Tax=Halomonas kalidii TaxID=3043293 RepID=A0ABT6VGT3_9GAMM|nr:cysteine dioxygenase [Halomonas kalidii]MDI5932477.1 cysteine dioxygenase [Halomonas kalidii]